MASRIIATLIVVLGVAALIWVSARGTDESTVTASSPTETTTSDTAEDPNDPTDRSDETESAAPATPTSTAADQGGATSTSAPTAEPTPGIEAPENFGPRMDLVDLDGWLNTDATRLSDFDGKVLLVEMWTFGCHNCKARIPYNQSYYEEFAGDSFEIIGVHAPEFSYESDIANIEQAIVDLGVSWPVALDNNKKNFRAWQPGSTNYWPRTFVIDQNGDIRYDHIGEGRYEELRDTIRYLVENPPAPNTVG